MGLGGGGKHNMMSHVSYLNQNDPIQVFLKNTDVKCS